jgi:hypothetical protein
MIVTTTTEIDSQLVTEYVGVVTREAPPAGCGSTADDAEGDGSAGWKGHPATRVSGRNRKGEGDG